MTQNSARARRAPETTQVYKREREGNGSEKFRNGVESNQASPRQISSKAEGSPTMTLPSAYRAIAWPAPACCAWTGKEASSAAQCPPASQCPRRIARTTVVRRADITAHGPTPFASPIVVARPVIGVPVQAPSELICTLRWAGPTRRSPTQRVGKA